MTNKSFVRWAAFGCLKGPSGAGKSEIPVKNCAFEELAHGVRTVTADQIYLSPSVTDTVVTDYVRGLSAPDGPDASPLTRREHEVLQLIAEGNSTRNIADKLCISVKTVDTHRKQIMDKLRIRSIAGLTIHAVREGLISVEP